MAAKYEEGFDMGDLGVPCTDLRREIRRIMNAAWDRRMTLRLLGALAFYFHCPAFAHLQEQLGRALTDIDFAARAENAPHIRTLFKDLGYEEDFMVTHLFGTGRLLFHDRINERHIDVFLDKLEFCHDVVFKERLEVDRITIPLAELLLEKMQIIQLNEKDVIDSIMLLREHPMGEADEEVINLGIIRALCADNWGWWKTLTTNLVKVKAVAQRYQVLSDEDRQVVGARIDQLLAEVNAAPKSLAWKMRDKIGEKVKWYRDVEELSR